MNNFVKHLKFIIYNFKMSVELIRTKPKSFRFSVSRLVIGLFPKLYPHLNKWFWNNLGGEEYSKKTLSLSRHIEARFIAKHILGCIAFNNALEIGCGTGENLSFFKDRFPDKEFVGCDFSQKQINQAKRFSNVKFDLADACSLPYEDKSFDVVITIGCLAHVPYQNISKVVKEIQRVTKYHLIILEENFRFATPFWMEYWKKMGWHFYHDYNNLFNEFHLITFRNDMLNKPVGLHTHVFSRSI